MNPFLFKKHIIVGVTGGIAAYKSADLVRRLVEAGAQVRVVMTHAAKQFVSCLTLQAVSGYPVHDDLFDLQAENAMGHIELARWADAIIIAPATADFLARLSQGEANDLLSTLCLATSAKIAVAPAMNQAMWKNTITQKNVQVLMEHGIVFFGPGFGLQACGDSGLGRMLEPLEIVREVSTLFSTQLLAGKHVVLTAGPTREAIDPVRYISNGSSGKMGYALAQAAVAAGARVTLISGPVNLSRLSHIHHVDVVSAQDMLQAVMQYIETADFFISVAAVADYRAPVIATHKASKKEKLTLVLEPTPDIVARVAALPNKPITIGFAAETEDVVNKAYAKLHRKKLDMVIANQVGSGIGIDADENAVIVLCGDRQKEFSKMSKTNLAKELIREIANTFSTVDSSTYSI